MSDDTRMKCPCCPGEVQVYWDDGARVAHVGEACQGWQDAAVLAQLLKQGQTLK